MEKEKEGERVVDRKEGKGHNQAPGHVSRGCVTGRRKWIPDI